MRFLMRGNVGVCVCVSVCLFCFGIFYPVLWLIFLFSVIIEYDIKIMSYQLKNFWSEKNKNWCLSSWKYLNVAGLSSNCFARTQSVIVRLMPHFLDVLMIAKGGWSLLLVKLSTLKEISYRELLFLYVVLNVLKYILIETDMKLF